MTDHSPPAGVPEFAKAAVRATPNGDTFTYDLWIVDGRRWTGPLDLDAAHERLELEGYRPGRARQLLYRARQKARVSA